MDKKIKHFTSLYTPFPYIKTHEEFEKALKSLIYDLTEAIIGKDEEPIKGYGSGAMNVDKMRRNQLRSEQRKLRDEVLK